MISPPIARARSLTLVLCLAQALLLACEPGGPPAETGPDSRPGRPATEAPSGRGGLASVEGDEALQVYYQFVDARGSVRFVSTLSAVPPEWRDRVGFVEMSGPPPGTPGEARRIRDARTAHLSLPARPAQASSSADQRGAGVTVIIYSADWCGACRRAKQYMDQNDIEYEARDVDIPEWKQEMFAKAGPGGIPVFDVGGEILRGFNARRLESLIERNS